MGLSGVSFSGVPRVCPDRERIQARGVPGVAVGVYSAQQGGVFWFLWRMYLCFPFGQFNHH